MHAAQRRSQPVELPGLGEIRRAPHPAGQKFADRETMLPIGVHQAGRKAGSGSCLLQMRFARVIGAECQPCRFVQSQKVATRVGLDAETAVDRAAGERQNAGGRREARHMRQRLGRNQAAGAVAARLRAMR